MNKLLFLTLFLLSSVIYSCKEEDDPPVKKEPVIDINDTPARVGDFRQGGIVFWVNSSDSTQGLVVALSDYLANAQWGCHGTSINGANRTSLFGGAKNTQDIIKDCNFAGIAADLCDEAVHDGYSDWYLPNTAEWAQIIVNLDTIEKAAQLNGGRSFYDTYWTSNQPTGVVGKTLAIVVDIRNNHYSQERKDGRFAVRAVRAF
jgi:hypothetical protein